MTDKTRYQVVAGSESAHCCFEATVIDTLNPIIYSGKHSTDRDGNLRYESICECFSVDDANKIADALNHSQNTAPSASTVDQSPA